MSAGSGKPAGLRLNFKAPSLTLKKAEPRKQQHNTTNTINDPWTDSGAWGMFLFVF